MQLSQFCKESYFIAWNIKIRFIFVMNLIIKWWSWIILVYGGYELVINTGVLRKKHAYISDCGWLTNAGQDNFWPHIKFLDTVSYEEMLLNIVADPGFPRIGGAKPKGGAPTYYLANFSRKLHENEEILGRGGARPSRPPLDPPLECHIWNVHLIFMDQQSQA